MPAADLCSQMHNWRRPHGNVLSMVAEFASDLIRMRTRDGMAIARAKGRLRGR